MSPSKSSRCQTLGLKVLLVSSLFSFTPPKMEAASPGKKTEKPATHTVTRGTLKAKVQLDAILESA